MLFNSLEYLIFLPLIFLLGHFSGQKWRWLILLFASLVFYMVLNIPYLVGVLLLVSVSTYGLGLWLHKAKEPRKKWLLLWGGITVNVAILVSLKYLPFLLSNLNLLADVLSLNVHVSDQWTLASIGVSYYVFQAISYLIDLYLETVEPEPHFGYFTLYLSFFPKLLQGPIERASDLLPQIRTAYQVDYDNLRGGLLLILWGMFKKLVIADRLAFFVNEVYDHIPSYSGISLLLATYFYAIQLYCDFSGYTDMALGSARLFNIRLTQNFNFPYGATSVADFWRRWHISFSRWILSYLFTPLQMVFRQARQWGTALALLIAFFASGLWHGANWTFIFWGLLHGLYLAVGTFYRKPQKNLYKKFKLDKTWLQTIWQTVVTFHLVCFSWIFFRANTLTDAFQVVRSLWSGFSSTLSEVVNPELRQHTLYLGQTAREFWLAVVFVGVLFAAHLVIKKHESIEQFLHSRTGWLRWAVYYALAFSTLIFAVYNSNNFVYFQF